MNTVTALPDAIAGAARLTDWGVIRASGEDARKFLHGQLTQDIEHLGPGVVRLAGFCSAKGRLQATFVVWARGRDELWLACSADLLPAVLKRLQMFVLRARCKLADLSGDRPVWGLAGDALHTVAAELRDGAWTEVDGADVVSLPAAEVGGASIARGLWIGPPAPSLPALDAAGWAALEVASGVPRVVAATVDLFVPQMVNLELVGGVNFSKGCYPGQEVVARSQYRGTIKRRMFRLLGGAALQPGQEIFSSADPAQPAGQVVLAAGVLGGPNQALAELRLAALQGGTLHAGAPDGPRLELAPLPYAVPVEAP